jgi:hypothetical protein
MDIIWHKHKMNCRDWGKLDKTIKIIYYGRKKNDLSLPRSYE